MSVAPSGGQVKASTSRKVEISNQRVIGLGATKNPLLDESSGVLGRVKAAKDGAHDRHLAQVTQQYTYVIIFTLAICRDGVNFSDASEQILKKKREKY